MTISKRLPLKSFLLATTIFASPLTVLAPIPALAQIAISVALEPPELPVYEQPPIPESGYIWTPGYWAYGNDVGYYWVPGTWVMPPEPEMLWTPPYWGWANGAYSFHEGYWGSHVGYYGGVNYGYGYDGNGYEGGQWAAGHFTYNRRANNFGEARITHVYESNLNVVNKSRVSFVGGPGGLNTQPTVEDRMVEHERHLPVTAAQTQHMTAAAKTPELAAHHNQGRPPIAATPRPAQLQGPGVVPARPVTGEHPPEHNGVPRPVPVREAPIERPVPAHPAPVGHEAPVEHAAPPLVAAHPAPAAKPPAAKPEEEKKPEH